MTSDREADDILEQWATVERALNDAKNKLALVARDSEEAAALRGEIDLLIDKWALLWGRYKDLVEKAKAEHEPAPLEWPEPAS